ncbi:hypothetical protein ACHAWO_010679 [Cyclotella atomus]|uniref:Phospholipid/glycerol acyltransferase domain-containing protein n=1 Tax=Cyclotella atomus TaxID=382360 RepID=A0ABD3QP39_9STRA
MKFSSIIFALLLSSSAAFAPPRPIRPQTSLPSTAEQTATETSTLSPDFQTARDASVSKIDGMLSTTKYAALSPPLIHFVDEYFRSLCDASASGAKNPDGSDITAQQAVKEMMRTIQFGMKYGLGEGKYTFENVRHRALRGKTFSVKDERYEDEAFCNMLGDDVNTDFYAAGCDFFRPSMDMERSLILGVDNMEKAMAQLAKGENVVFLANHQSEADPQVVSCLFEKAGDKYGKLAADITYVAGHKVTTDPLAIPFSMGRNLLCIHSKKHIDADPETKPAKSKQNMAAMNEMLQGMKDGGMAIWVAPSGGRDRRTVSNGKIPIATFDQKTVDMFRLMGNKSKRPTHFYPMAMVSYDLCPPPDFVEAGVGEKRNVRFTPVGIKVMEEVPNVGGAEKRHLFTHSAEFETIKGYEELLKGMGMERYI